MNRALFRYSLYVVLFWSPLFPFEVRGQEGDKIIKMTAAEFIAASKNGKQAEKKFKGTLIEVTDKLYYVGRITASGTPSVEVMTDSRKLLFCRPRDPQPWATFAAGQRVKIVGTFVYRGVPTLDQCELTPVDKTGGPIVVSAEALAKETAMGFKAMNAKYRDATLIVSGKVLSATKDKSTAVTLSLQGFGKIIVSAQIPALDVATTSTFTPGQPITFAARYGYMDGTKVSLNHCLPIDPK